MIQGSPEYSAALASALSKLTSEELALLQKYFSRNADEPVSKCRRSFSPEEDDKLKTLVEKHGESNWNAVAAEMPGRNVRQCRERWKHYLSPEVSNLPWTPEEDELLLQKTQELGSKWVQISKLFKKRTDINVKNRWIVLMRRNTNPVENKDMRPMETVSDQTINQPRLFPNLVADTTSNRTNVAQVPLKKQTLGILSLTPSLLM